MPDTTATHATHATIRPARPGDLAAVERLLRGAELPVDGVADALGDFVVAEAAGAIVGVAGLETAGENALLRSVAVDPAWRSAGVGRALVERIVAYAEARGVPGLYLLTTTAERWFPAFGFAPVGREMVPADVRATREFASVCPSSATVMCRLCAPAGG